MFFSPSNPVIFNTCTFKFILSKRNHWIFINMFIIFYLYFWSFISRCGLFDDDSNWQHYCFTCRMSLKKSGENNTCVRNKTSKRIKNTLIPPSTLPADDKWTKKMCWPNDTQPNMTFHAQPDHKKRLFGNELLQKMLQERSATRNVQHHAIKLKKDLHPNNQFSAS